MENYINNKNDELSGESSNGKKKETRRVIKTYRDFAVHALEDKPTSLAKMIIKEKKKRNAQEEVSVKNPKNIFMITLSSILVVLGVIAIASIIIFINTRKDEREDKKFSSNVNSSIEFDYKKMFELDGLNSIKSASDEAFDNTTIPFGTIKNIFFTKKDNLGYPVQISPKDFLRELDTRVPNQFIRNLGSKFSAGVVSLEENKPFLILETINFDASYSNLLAWEKTMLYDMGGLFRVNQKYYATQFSDIILFNKDVRAVLDEEGNLVFGYSFIDPHKIVFFTDNQVLKIILNNSRNFIKN